MIAKRMNMTMLPLLVALRLLMLKMIHGHPHLDDENGKPNATLEGWINQTLSLLQATTFQGPARSIPHRT